MSPRRASSVLCSLGCAVALSVGVPVAAAEGAPPPPDLSRLPPPPVVPPLGPQSAPEAARAASVPTLPENVTDPSVQETVVEDDNARIDELKVRGRSKRIVVKPKHGPEYEIIPPGSGPNISQGARGTNGAAGKRVWPVLSF